MTLINYLGIALLFILVAAAPPADNTEDDKIVVNSELFINDCVVYTSEHDIVALTVPLNLVNFGEDTDDSKIDITLYFVEADVNDKGKKDYKGLYSLKNGNATKVLETGTDATACDDGSKQVYFSAKDGIYVYDGKLNKLEKYGTITDSLMSIVKLKGSDVIYVLTEDHNVYTVTDGGNKKEKLHDVNDAQQIVLDYANTLYFYGKDKVPYVVTTDGTKKITGLPENPTYVQLIKPPFIIENGVVFASDDKVYTIYANGTCELTDFILHLKPTAYAPEAAIIQYYSYNKKIYEYNILQLIMGELLITLKTVLEDKADEIDHPNCFR